MFNTFKRHNAIHLAGHGYIKKDYADGESCFTDDISQARKWFICWDAIQYADTLRSLQTWANTAVIKV